MKKLLVLLSFSIFLFSCEEVEKVTHVPGDQALAYFETSSTNLPVDINASGSITIRVAATTLSTASRTVNVEFDADASELPATAFTFNNQITIAAGSYFGDLEIMVPDSNLITPSPKPIVFKVGQVSDGMFADDTVLRASVFKVCPLPADMFVGDYLIEQTTAFVDGPTLSDGTVVTLTLVDGEETGRTFLTSNYPNFCSTPNPFTFNLICDQVLVQDNQSNCQCNGNLFFTAATTPGTFDIADDTTFTLTFTDDAFNDCGAPVQTSYTFTKQ